MVGIAVHGGAGRWAPERSHEAQEGIRAAAEIGRRNLIEGEPALAATISAVAALEDNPVFNAGTGASLTLDGQAELDAGVMDGRDLATGNVAALAGVRHPVAVARAVMETSGHALLAGEGATRFARSLGFPTYDPVTETVRERWRRLRAELESGAQGPDELRELLRRHPELGGDTVGSVACDGSGNLAAATSTGGTMLKLPGRIGDSPLPGAGTYADRYCAVSATGHGELMIRFGTARAVADRVRSGQAPQQAVTEVLDAMAKQLGTEVGLIAVDHAGRLGVTHRTPAMPHATASGTGTAEPRISRD